MKSSNELKRLLESIDRKSYPAYKSAQGIYDFGDYQLCIDHVQGDPFASPSKLSIFITHQKAGYPKTLFDAPHKKRAFEDDLVRRFYKETARYNFKAKGSGKSGLISISCPGPEILERTACECCSDGIWIRLEAGVYDHIAGDGREFVITDDTALKLRAEDGRSIRNVDISMFINDLPNKKDTRCFSTEDASGSTSQAAAVIEGIESGSRVFLIDEDTSATNFMVRDDLMQKVINRSQEPITPFTNRAEDLFHKAGISTVLVAGSSGAYFYIADTIIQMDSYVPLDITKKVKEICAGDNRPSIEPAPGFTLPKAGRKFQIKAEKDHRKQDMNVKEGRRGREQGGRDDRIKVKVYGKDSIEVGRRPSELRFVEQLIDSEQTQALAQILRFCMEKRLLERYTVAETVAYIQKETAKGGLTAVSGCSYAAMGLCMPRPQEIFACINRFRG